VEHHGEVTINNHSCGVVCKLTFAKVTYTPDSVSVIPVKVTHTPVSVSVIPVTAIISVTYFSG